LRIKLPEEVTLLYRIVDSLEKKYPGRPFTPDGHLVGSLGEVIAEESFELLLYPPSYPAHDASTFDGKEVQVKLTGGKSIGMRGEPEYLLVMHIVDPDHAEVIYNGPGQIVWNAAGKMQKNGQRNVGTTKLRELDKFVAESDRIKARDYD